MDEYKVSVLVEFTISGENLKIGDAAVAAGDRLRALETPMTITDIYVHRTDPRSDLESFVRGMEREQGPVTEEEKQVVREQWKPAASGKPENG